MGKSIVQILEVAAVVAVQAFPGIGQAVGFAIGVSATAGTAIATAAVALTEGVVNSTILAPKSAKPATTETALRPDLDIFSGSLCISSGLTKRPLRPDALFVADEDGRSYRAAA